MEREIRCHKCNKWYPAYLDDPEVDIMNPKCPVCKSVDVHIWNDEIDADESPRGDDELGDEDE